MPFSGLHFRVPPSPVTPHGATPSPDTLTVRLLLPFHASLRIARARR